MGSHQTAEMILIVCPQYLNAKLTNENQQQGIHLITPPMAPYEALPPPGARATPPQRTRPAAAAQQVMPMCSVCLHCSLHLTSESLYPARYSQATHQTLVEKIGHVSCWTYNISAPQATPGSAKSSPELETVPFVMYPDCTRPHP